MREATDAAKVHLFMERLGRAVRGPGRVYFTGGVTALLFGWRPKTVDVDLKFDPEPPGCFEAIARLKDELSINVELASPDDFLPALPGWRERSVPIGREGRVEFLHYDLRAQALAKIERGHSRDLGDVREMFARGLVAADELRRLFAAIEPELVRFPAIDPAAFRRRLDEALP